MDGAAEAVAHAAGGAVVVVGRGVGDAWFARERELGVRGGFDGGGARVEEGLQAVAGAAGPEVGEDGWVEVGGGGGVLEGGGGVLGGGRWGGGEGGAGWGWVGVGG